jgi:large subunit ribosomal protein L24
MAAKVKKGDTVIVLTGRYKGSEGKVTKVIKETDRVVVEGVNIVTRHQRPNQFDPGGLKRFEAPIHISNVAHKDPVDGKPVRVGFKADEHGRKTRFAKRSGEQIDV